MDLAGFMHEAFYKNDPTRFTRPWFIHFYRLIMLKKILSLFLWTLEVSGY